MFGYRIPDANEAMLIVGGRTRGEGAPPVKVILGRGAFVMPFVRRAQFLTLAMQQSEVVEQCYTTQGIIVQVRAVCAFKVAPDEDSIVNAAQRFLSDQASMSALTGRIVAGHLRSIIGAMTVEDIIQKRQTLATEVLDASKTELEKLGLLVDSFQIESIDDGDSENGYIAKMAAPHRATIAQAAAIAQAEADRASAEAEQNAARQQSNYAKETEVLRAQNKAAIDAQEAQAAQAGPLAQASAQQAVLDEQTKVAQRTAELAEQQLLATVVKPAEAEKQAKIAHAQADAEATKLAAGAAASENRVSLDQLLIEQLPEVAKAVASGLQGSNLTVLNGTDGLGEVITGLISQAQDIYTAARSATRTGQLNGDGRTARIETGGAAQN